MKFVIFVSIAILGCYGLPQTHKHGHVAGNDYRFPLDATPAVKPIQNGFSMIIVDAKPTDVKTTDAAINLTSTKAPSAKCDRKGHRNAAEKPAMIIKNFFRIETHPIDVKIAVPNQLPTSTTEAPTQQATTHGNTSKPNQTEAIANTSVIPTKMVKTEANTTVTPTAGLMAVKPKRAQPRLFNLFSA